MLRADIAAANALIAKVALSQEDVDEANALIAKSARAPVQPTRAAASVGWSGGEISTGSPEAI